ncbi:hypothetical protein ACOMHN_008041 [Nucella lapillus]
MAAAGYGQPKKSRVPRGARNTGKKANCHFRRKNPIKNCSEPAQVINLSTVELSKEQEQLLSRGPKFCPTPASYSERQLLDDSLEGLRRVRLKEYWYDEEAPVLIPRRPKEYWYDEEAPVLIPRRPKEYWYDEEAPVLIPRRPKFYKKNYWEPPKGRDDSLDAFCSTVVSRVTAHEPRLPKQRNIRRKSQEATLQQLRDLVQKRILRISPADKGGAVVVQSFSQYHKEAMRQLGNTEHYRTSQEDLSQDIAKQSNEFVHNLHRQEMIDDKCHEWAKIKNDVKRPTFYHLPKVHKNNQNPPGRPIVSGISGATEHLSKLVDHWLQPVVHKRK